MQKMRHGEYLKKKLARSLLADNDDDQPHEHNYTEEGMAFQDKED